MVAPPAGAWIETPAVADSGKIFSVAPPAGAWIETIYDQPPTVNRSSRSPCGSVD